jgi:hypothetical protein
MALVDPALFYDDEGNLRPIKNVPIEARRALTGFEELEQYDKDGVSRGMLRKVKFATKAPYFEMLGKFFKVLTSNVAVTTERRLSLPALPPMRCAERAPMPALPLTIIWPLSESYHMVLSIAVNSLRLRESVIGANL